MVNIIYLICLALIGFLIGAFASFVISKLRKIDSQTDNIHKYHWSMGIYMNDIPQNDQNTPNLTRFFRRKPICFSNGMNPSI